MGDEPQSRKLLKFPYLAHRKTCVLVCILKLFPSLKPEKKYYSTNILHPRPQAVGRKIYKHHLNEKVRPHG